MEGSTFRGSAWTPEGRLRYGRPARSGRSAAVPREGTEAAGTGAARGSSTVTHPCPRTRTGSGVAARRGGLRGDHPERRPGGSTGRDTGTGRAEWQDGLTAASTTGQSSGSGTGEPAGTTVHRVHRAFHGPGSRVGRRAEPALPPEAAVRPTAHGGRGGGPSVSGGPTPGAAFADGRGLGSARCAHHGRHRVGGSQEGAPGAPSSRGDPRGRRSNRTG
jgi:hypothetical protein